MSSRRLFLLKSIDHVLENNQEYGIFKAPMRDLSANPPYISPAADETAFNVLSLAGFGPAPLYTSLSVLYTSTLSGTSGPF